MRVSGNDSIRPRVKTLLRVVAVLGLTVAVAIPVAAADTGWTVDAFHADIEIRSTGSLAIVETIDVTFGGLETHGIIRTIPTRYRYDDRRDRTYALSVQSVTDRTGRAWTYQLTRSDASVEIKIGDPNRTLSGARSYRIAYTVQGALNAFSDHGELYWNVNGADWGVPTRAASATVTAPSGALLQLACFQGATGSTEPCRSAAAERGPNGVSLASFTSRALSPGEQLTVVAGLSLGAVTVAPPVLVDRPRGIADYFATSPTALALAAVVFAGGLFLVWWVWWSRGRDRGPAQGAIVPEYEPPAKLRPAQLGVVVDEVADPRDLVATIVDLAVRGHLSITEHPKQGLFGHPDWTLDKRKPADDLLPYERELFDGLFSGGDSVLLSSLKGTFAPTLKRAEALLYADAMGHGWFVADPSRVRTAYAGVGCLTVVAGGGLVYLLGQAFGCGLVGVAIVPAGLALLVMNRAMPAHTASGAQLLAQTLGFKRYMDTAETDRAKFAEKEGLFTAYLPYAVMFGSVERWTRAFAGLDLAKATSSFYMGPSAFNSVLFASSFSSFSGSLASTVVSTPAGSGGSGFSGGFSGGGGGGGGGGSW